MPGHQNKLSHNLIYNLSIFVLYEDKYQSGIPPDTYWHNCVNSHNMEDYSKYNQVLKLVRSKQDMQYSPFHSW